LDAVSGFPSDRRALGIRHRERRRRGAEHKLERGDTEAALATLASADERIDDLATAGMVRLVFAGGAIIALLVAFSLIMTAGSDGATSTPRRTTTKETGPATV
jgi:hypothetical protein